MTPQLYIATNGLGVWTSDDLGESLVRMNSRAGMYSGYHIWAFANDPSEANVLLAGTNGGLFRLDRRQKKWSHIPSPMDKRFKITNGGHAGKGHQAHRHGSPDIAAAGGVPG